MQMSTRCEGDFTTNSSVVAQILKRQDVCLVSFKNPTTHGLSLRKSHRDDVFILKTTVYYYDKIASEGEGRKPSSDRQKYIVESEFALLGILSKTMSNSIFLFRFQWTTWMQAEIINV